MSSVHSTAELVTSILRNISLRAVDPLIAPALNEWSRLGGNVVPSGDASAIQINWDSQIMAHSFLNLLNAASDDYSKARLLASSSPHSGD